MKTWVVLPTYNEAENLREMASAILENLPQANLLIVDDNSPDGTGRIAEDLVGKNPGRIKVIHREKKEGLGKAYLHGFKVVLEMGAEVVFQMDSDFSHPPSLLPQMLKTLGQYDFVLGSRYIPGGGIRNWNWLRRMISRGGNFYARSVLNSPIRDLTGGFKAFNRRVLEYLLTCPLDSSGYCFQIETTTYALAGGFSCQEIPFIFTEREKGSSKMSRGIVFEAFRKTYQLRKKIQQGTPPLYEKPAGR